MPRAPSGMFRSPSSVACPAAMRTSRSSPFPAINPSPLHREGEGFRQLARFPFGGVLQRFDRPRLIKMEYSVELICQPRLEIVAHTLGFGTIDHPDRPLEPGIAEGIAERLIRLPVEQERGGENGMEQ